jgi:hypothetical protein
MLERRARLSPVAGAPEPGAVVGERASELKARL